MSTTSINHTSLGYRLVERDLAPSRTPVIDALLIGDVYPIVRAAHREGRWFVTAGPELPQAVDPEFRFPPPFYVESHRDARVWVELLAAMHAKVVGR